MAIYNIKQFDYANETQIRIYRNPVYDNQKSLNYVGRKKQQIEDIEEIEDDEAQYSEYEQIDFDNYREEMQAYEAEQNMLKKMKERTPEQIEHSLRVSRTRSKQVIFEISRANEWDWFITLTFDRNLIDSSNYDLLIEKVRKWFNNIKNRKAPDMKYLIIPELHKDGVHYHFHGLLADCGGLGFEKSGIVQDGKEVYNITGFPYGFTTATKVDDTVRVSGYIAKYITKELQNAVKGKRRYLASNNCKRAEISKYYIPPEMLEQFIFDNSRYIKHISQQKVSEAHQIIQYLELSNPSNT